EAVQHFTLRVEAPPAIRSAAATAFIVGTAGSFTIMADGFPTPAIALMGALPDGLTFKDNSDGTATLQGTPTTTGRFALTVTSSNGLGPEGVQGFTLSINPVPLPAPAPMPPVPILPLAPTPSPPAVPHVYLFAVGADAGALSQVNVYEAQTQTLKY